MTSFYKYHGAGNDFIMINNLNKSINLTVDDIKLLCDRHFGVGADGLILLESSNKADCFMSYYNSDGTEAEMCGNGVRCTAKFFLEQTNSTLNELNIDTRAGIKKIIVSEDNTYSVNMSTPVFIHPDFPNESKNIEGFQFNFVSMGNPHAVTLVENLNNIDLKIVGPKVENNSLFLHKINVEFVEKVSDDYYKVLVWERGCGATLACGTGACAIFATLSQGQSLRKNEITLEFPGGKLYLSKNPEGQIILRGPATFVFKGEIK
ncbi:MAG TPA: diaminopimelate epimerase [Candidatus Paceibacterota bacterium]|nr:diaminopimelate epimerase [Candidatus Paceibacterota bacterium]